MIIKINSTSRDIVELTEKTRKGRNIISTISKSNKRKIKVKKKYRKENGTRETLWCSNPHSKEETSSRIKGTLSEIKNDTTFKNNTSANLISKSPNNKNINIYFTLL